jgi:hypothetical protein
VRPVVTGEHTAARIDQRYQSIWVLNAHHAVDVAGDVEPILVGWVLVSGQSLIPLLELTIFSCPEYPARRSQP